MSALMINDLNAVTPTDADSELAVESSRSLALRLPKGKRFTLQIDEDGEALAIPQSAARVLLRALTEMAQGNTVSVVPTLSELSTQQAAELLGVSRPYVVKLLDDKQLPSRKVGTHRRVLYLDLMKYKTELDAKRMEALQELTDQAQELKMGY